MLYFAYGSNLNAAAVAQWCRHHDESPLALRSPRRAVLDNYRLCFSCFSPYWGGGTADIVYDPGKYVAGVLFKVTEKDMQVLDRKVERQVDAAGRDSGVYSRIELAISPLDTADSVTAFVYKGVAPSQMHYPPTRHYMNQLLHGAASHGLSSMWIAYLESFTVQESQRKPRPTKSQKEPRATRS